MGLCLCVNRERQGDEVLGFLQGFLPAFVQGVSSLFLDLVLMGLGVFDFPSNSIVARYRVVEIVGAPACDQREKEAKTT